MRFLLFILLIICLSGFCSNEKTRSVEQKKETYCQYGYHTGGIIKTDSSEISWTGLDFPEYCLPYLNDSVMSTLNSLSAFIFDRWGKIHYQTDSSDGPWICNDDSAQCPAPPGTYAVSFLLKAKDGSRDTLNTILQLIEFEK